MALSDVLIRTAKAIDKPIKLFDGGGLFLQVTPAGGKWWRLKYRFAGKEMSRGIAPISSRRSRTSQTRQSPKAPKPEILSDFLNQAHFSSMHSFFMIGQIAMG